MRKCCPVKMRLVKLLHTIWLAMYTIQLTSVTMTPVITQPQDMCSPMPVDDAVQSKKTFRLFRKTAKKKVTRPLGLTIAFIITLVAQ